MSSGQGRRNLVRVCLFSHRNPLSFVLTNGHVLLGWQPAVDDNDLVVNDVGDRHRVKDLAKQLEHGIVIVCLDFALEAVDCERWFR